MRGGQSTSNQRAAWIPPAARLPLFGLLLFAASAVLLALTASAATTVPPGALSGNNTWAAAGSPYTVQGDLQVGFGANLNVGPGTIVEVADSATISVMGRLNLFGVPGQVVVFRPQSGANSWGGFVISGTGSARFENASIERAWNGVVASTSGTVVVSDTTILRSSVDGVSVVGSTGGVFLFRVTIQTATNGVRALGGVANLNADKVAVSDAYQCFVVGGATNVTLRVSSMKSCWGSGASISGAANVTIDSTEFADFGDYGVDVHGSNRVKVSFSSFDAEEPRAAVWFTATRDSLVHYNSITMTEWPADHVFRNDPVGILVANPAGQNTLSNNQVSLYPIGIEVLSASLNQILDSNMVGPGQGTGIWLSQSSNQTLTWNQINGMTVALSVTSATITVRGHFRHTMTGNTANGRAILWAMDVHGQSISAQALSILSIVDSDNVTVFGETLTDGNPSLLIQNSTDILVRDTTVSSAADDGKAVEVTQSRRVVLQNVSANASLTCLSFRDGQGNRVSDFAPQRCAQSVLSAGTERDLLVERMTVTYLGRVSFFEGTNLTLRDSSFEGTYQTGVTNRRLKTLKPPAPPMPPPPSEGGPPQPPPGPPGPDENDVLGVPQDVFVVNVTMRALSYGVIVGDFSGLTLRAVTVTQTSTATSFTNMSGVRIQNSSFSAVSYSIEARDSYDLQVWNTSISGGQLAGFLLLRCTNATIAGNIFTATTRGLVIGNGAGSVVTRNIFLYNSLHASTNSSANFWDDGAVGNLWDDYTGVDADLNGIGDTPYPIWGGAAEDRYPIARYPDTIPPVADAGPDLQAYEDFPVLLSGFASTDNIGIRTMLWSLVDGGYNVTVAGTFVLYYFATPGTYTVTLTVIDWGGNRATDTVLVLIRDRTPPVANGGGNRTVDEDVAVALDGSLSTDNDPAFPQGAQFSWYIHDGPTLQLALGRQTSWVFATPGVYEVELVLEDNVGLQDNNSFWITVRDTTAPDVPPLQAPTPREDVTFRVYGSNATDNDPFWPVGRTTWFELWQFGVHVNTSTDNPGVFYVVEPGTYTAWYFVSDAAGNVGSANVTFMVADATQPNLSQYHDRSVEAGEPITFDASLAFDNDVAFPAGASATWKISILTGQIVLQGLSTNFTFSSVGDYRVELQMTDASGNLAISSFTVHAYDSEAPRGTIEGPVVLEAGEAALFRVNATDASGISSYQWTMTGVSGGRQGRSTTYQLFVPGTYTITVAMEDFLGNSGNITLDISVVDSISPAVFLNVNPLPVNGTVELRAEQVFEAAFLGTDHSQIVLVEWGWGDGTFSNGTTQAHNWSEPGNYTVIVRAVDAWGNANATTMHVHVSPIPVIPPPPNPQPTPTAVPTNTGLGDIAVVLILLAGIAAGIVLGFRFGRGARLQQAKRPSENEQPPANP